MQHNYMIMHIAKIGNQGLNPDINAVAVPGDPNITRDIIGEYMTKFCKLQLYMLKEHNRRLH